MDKCSFSPEQCVSYAEALVSNFDNPSLLASRAEWTDDREQLEYIRQAIKNHDELKTYCDTVLGKEALTLCIIHQNEDNIPANQGLPTLYRYHQTRRAISDAPRPPRSEDTNTTEITLVIDGPTLHSLSGIDTPTKAEPENTKHNVHKRVA